LLLSILLAEGVATNSKYTTNPGPLLRLRSSLELSQNLDIEELSGLARMRTEFTVV